MDELGLMSLGQFVFQLPQLAPHSVDRNRSWSYASNETAQGRNKKQFTGPGDDTVTLHCVLYPLHQLGDRAALEEAVRMADSGEPYLLIDGQGFMYGQYVIESIDENHHYLTIAGKAQKVDCTLHLTRIDDQQIDALVAPLNSLVEP